MKKILSSLLIVLLVFSFSISCFADISEADREAANYGHVAVGGTSHTVKWALKAKHNKSFDTSNYGVDSSLKYFHGMFYEAKTTKKVNASIVGSSKTEEIKKGTTLLIIRFTKKNCICRLTNKKTVAIPGKYLKVVKFVYNSNGAYRDAQVEEWVEKNRLDSKTKYMMVISKFNQHAWILEKKSGKWVCKYVLKITTSSWRNSKGKHPNDYYGLTTCAINTHYKNKKNVGADGKGISYASKEGGNQLHTRGNSLYPSTHGCVGMSTKDYNFVYNYLPVGTRVVLF